MTALKPKPVLAILFKSAVGRAVAQAPRHPKTALCEELLDRPFEMLTNEEWEQLREFEPTLELVAA